MKPMKSDLPQGAQDFTRCSTNVFRREISSSCLDMLMIKIQVARRKLTEILRSFGG
jgi:hypothetical protein